MSIRSFFAGLKRTLPLEPSPVDDVTTGQDVVIKFLSATVCFH
jgi:hypothetical protein